MRAEARCYGLELYIHVGLASTCTAAAVERIGAVRCTVLVRPHRVIPYEDNQPAACTDCIKLTSSYDRVLLSRPEKEEPSIDPPRISIGAMSTLVIRVNVRLGIATWMLSFGSAYR